MARSDSIHQLQKVNVIRKDRLGRALKTARAFETEAKQAEIEAETSLKKSEAQSVAARDQMAQNPACLQTRLWNSVSKEQADQARVQLDVARDDHQSATDKASAASKAVHRHEVKSDAILNYGRNLARHEALRNEIRAED